MAIDYREFSRLIRQITEEVLKRLEEDPQVDTMPKTLALFPDYVFDGEGIKKRLKATCKEPVLCALLGNAQFQGGEGFEIRRIESTEDRQALMTGLRQYERFAFVTPPPHLLQALAKGEDSFFEVQALIRPLLWGCEVTVYLDFEAPKFRRGTFFEKLVDAIDVITAMGIRVETLAEERPVKHEGWSLITDLEVKEAYNNGTNRLKLSVGGIITPLARDTAKELNVIIDY